MVVSSESCRAAPTARWDALAESVLAGNTLERTAAMAILTCPEGELPALLRATRRVREHHHGRRVKLCVLRNARSGLCPEDCHYCSQSAISDAAIPRYRLDSVPELVTHARRAVAAGARRYCMVTSGRGPSQTDIDRFTAAARAIKAEFPALELCVSLGIMSEAQAHDLKAAGIGWVNHNLNTSERFHPEICATHTYADRVRTVRNVQQAGLSTCSGGIVGLGEQDEDVIDLAFALRDLRVDSLPLNFLIPIDGTPLADTRELDPARCLKALCLFRLTNPCAEIRVAGGRELNLGWFQSLALLAANSIFVDGYLTTPGQDTAAAHEMIAAMGFVVEAAPDAATTD
ncbi:MAG TPA: biotin synthase BioB [Candidatus Binatia bacterium]|nr:biotin synthase BioB [Candidatus Binatia bacterium]